MQFCHQNHAIHAQPLETPLSAAHALENLHTATASLATYEPAPDTGTTDKPVQEASKDSNQDNAEKSSLFAESKTCTIRGSYPSKISRRTHEHYVELVSW